MFRKLWLFVYAMLFGRPRKPLHPYALNREVVRLSTGDALDWSSLCRGVLLTGGIGSGKTSGPSDAILTVLLETGCSGVILTARPDDYDRLFKLARRAGREKDVIRFAPGERWTCDFLQWELQPRDGATGENAADLLNTLISVTARQGGKDSDGAYWVEITSKAVRMGLMALQLAKAPCSVSDLYRLVTTAPTGSEGAQILAGSIRDVESLPFALQVLVAAKAWGEPHDAALVRNFWAVEFAQLSDKTRSIVLSMLTNTLAPFMPHAVYSMLSAGASTITPRDVVERGKIVIVDMPPVVWHLTGVLVGVTWKLMVQREVLRRKVVGNPQPVFVACDECHLFAVESDVTVQALARHARLININVGQNLPLLIHAFGGADRRAAVDAWVGNLACKFVCANSDNETNKYYAELFGTRKKHLFSGSVDGSYDVISDAFGMGGGIESKFSFAENIQPAIPAHKFGELLTGGIENDRIVECYLHVAGRIFNNGKPYTKVRFMQSRK